MITWRQVRRYYDDLRLRYYQDAEDPLRLPPPAAELTWRWAPDKGNLAETVFEPSTPAGRPAVDAHVVGVNLNVVVARSGQRVLKLCLLHELSHMRNPAANCGRGSRWWREECSRLAAAGAFWEVF